MTEPRPVRYRTTLNARFESNGKLESVQVLDLSETGAFLTHVAEPGELQIGDSGTLVFSVPGGGGPLRAPAIVSRFGTTRLELKHPTVAHLTVAREGFGIEFDGIDEDELERLRDFLELLDAR